MTPLALAVLAGIISGDACGMRYIILPLLSVIRIRKDIRYEQTGLQTTRRVVGISLSHLILVLRDYVFHS